MALNIHRLTFILAIRAASALGLTLLSFGISYFYSLAEAGKWAVVISISIGISVLSKLSLDTLAIRKVGAATEKPEEAAKFLRSAFFLSTATWASISLILLASLAFYLKTDLQAKADIFKLGLLLALPLAYGHVLGSALRASTMYMRGQLTEIGSFSLIMSALITANELWAFKHELETIFKLSVFVYFITLAIISMEFIPLIKSSSSTSSLNLKSDGMSIFLLYCTSILQYACAWFGLYLSSLVISLHQVGEISIGQRASMILFLFLSTTQGILAPQYAEMWKNRNIQEIKNSENRTRIKLFLTSMTALPIILISLHLISSRINFSSEGLIAAAALLFAQAINLACACSTSLLIATGNDRSFFFSYLVGATLGLPSIFILGESWGVIGASIGIGISTITPAIIAQILTIKILRGAKI